MAGPLELSWLQLPTTPRMVYPKPPLVLALCQVQFAKVLKVADREWISSFQEAIRQEYPVTTEIKQLQQNVQVTVGAGQGELASNISSDMSTGWRFADASEDWSVTLTTDAVSLETRSYGDFEEFRSRLHRLLGVLIEHVNPTLATRLGLRYTNELRSSESGWFKTVRPELLGPLAVADFGGRVAQSIHHFVLNVDRSVKMNVIHGMFPDGTVVQPRSGDDVPSGPFYLLDLDVYEDATRKNVMVINSDLITDRIREFHEVISRVFRWALTESFVETLGGVGSDVA